MKKTNNKKTIIQFIIIAILLIGISFSIFFLLKSEPKQENIVEQEVVEVIEVEEEETPLFTKEEYDNYYSINNDYIGQIIFESGIINEPVLYSSINSYYLRKNINKEYSIQGSVYLDERNTINDQNLILYGHYTEPGFTNYDGYDPNVRPMFSNLELLLDKENYETNKTVYLYLKDEVITYEVACVYYCPLIKDEETNEYVYVTEGYEYYITNYSEEEFNTYKETIKNNQRYETGIGLTNYNNYLTLQTCVNAREDLREIVLCKEVSRSTYD